MSNKSDKHQHPTQASETPQPETAPAPTIGEQPSQAPQAPTPEEIAALQAKAGKADEYWERLVRQAADFDNYKKRAVRERQDAVKFANQALLEKLIGVLDHFEMAIAANGSETQPANLDSFKDGVQMICNQFKSVLVESGLEEIDAHQQVFDPNIHEAVSQQESADVPEGHVMQQLRKGYKLRERLLRPATVIVAKKPASH
jgi:molecular chaperone GrpE